MATRQIPWARIVAEGVAIVVSILLAFGIQAWWDARQATSLEIDILRALAEEVAVNQGVLQNNQGINSVQLELIDRFLKSIPEALAEAPTDSVLLFADAFTRPVTFDPLTGSATLLSQTSILSSDGITIRAMVSEWLARISDVDEEKGALARRTELLQDALTPYAARAANRGAVRTAEMIASLGGEVLGQMRGDSRFVEALVIKAAVQGVYLRNLGSLMEDLDSLSATLRKDIGS